MDRLKSAAEMGEDFQRILQPLEHAHTLPSYYYLSGDIFERERGAVFSKEWMMLGRDDEISQPGDYFKVDVMDEPLIVCRGEDGEVRAFSATCRHRGAVIAEGRGNKRNFECPFHGWVYSQSGELRAAPHMHRTEGFDPKQCRLPAVRTELWKGFIFINFDEDAAPLAPRLAGVEERFANYKIEDMRSSGKPMVFRNDCNWKLSVEQGIDMYHVPATHPEVGHFYNVGETFGEEDPSRAWTTSFTPCKMPHPHVSGTKLAKSPFPAVAGLTEFELSSFNMFLIYPNSLVACVPDGLVYFSYQPDGPHSTLVTMNVAFPESTVQLPDFVRNAEDSRKGLEELNYQDMNGARITHAGMNSGSAPRGRFSHLERTTWEVGKYMVRCLQAADPSLEVA